LDKNSKTKLPQTYRNKSPAEFETLHRGPVNSIVRTISYGWDLERFTGYIKPVDDPIHQFINYAARKLPAYSHEILILTVNNKSKSYN
jgi:hypothetical protein